MLQAIINFFRKLFGLGQDTDNRQLGQSQSQGHQSQGHQSPSSAQQVDDDDDDDDDGHKVLRRVDGAVLIHDEEDDETMWVSEIDLDVRPEEYQDDFGPLSGPEDLDKYLFHDTEIHLAMQGDAEEAERKAQGFGYAHIGQFYRVRGTMLKYKGTRSGETLDGFSFSSEDAMRAAMGGAHLRQAQESEAALAAKPELLAPVDGVDLDTYAKLAASAASGLSQDQFNAMLGQHGLDAAKWQEVSAVWNDRMSKDTSMTITTAYSKAFGNAGAGQFGAAGQAGAAAMGTTNAAAGEEPVSFERYCEIQGAQTAWANSGQDVNAMLEQVFDMTALDWSTMSMWWMQKMQSEPSLWQRHSELCAKYEQQYGGGGMAGADDDLSF